MKGINNFIIGALVVIATIVTIAVITIKPPQASVGGSFNPVVVDFAQGISVGGTQVITSSRGFNAAALTIPNLTPTADTTLTAAQSGITVSMGVAGLDVTLPPVATSSGAKYRFTVGAAFATTSMTVVSAEGDNLEGSIIVAGAVVDCDANDVITFVNDGENIGDFVELQSNGTYWLIGPSNGLTASKTTCTG